MEPLPAGVDDRTSYCHLKKVRKTLREVIDPFLLPDKAFMKEFRLSKPLVRDLIEDLRPFIHFGALWWEWWCCIHRDKGKILKSSYQVHCKKLRHSKSKFCLCSQVLTALNFYATGSYQRSIGQNWIHCLARTTTGKCIREVTDALNMPQIQKKWIKFPKTRAERRKVIQR